MTQDSLPFPQRRSFRVVVRLHAELPTDPYDELREAAARLGLRELADALTELGVPTARLIPRTTIEPATLRARELEVREEEDRADPEDPASMEDPNDPELSVSLTQYWLVDLSGSPHDPVEVAARLEQLDDVELAYPELPVINAGGQDGAAGPASGPSHLDRAPIGSNVRFAWEREQYGAEVQVLDVESGWLFDHEALQPLGVQLLGGVNQDGVGGFSGGHGTAALGIVAGTFVAPSGVYGIAPRAGVLAASPFNGDLPVLPLADVLTQALLSLRRGDVVLIEVAALEGGTTTKWQRPIERQVDVRAAIRLLTRSGIVVIEPAGNGDTDLDSLETASGRSPLTPGEPGYVDSGAVMVGGAFVDPSRPDAPKRWVSGDDPGVGSNFGRRVDCFSWARKVRTSGCRPWGNCKPPTSAYQSFNGTSSASAIIAGVAVLVQGLHNDAGQPLPSSRRLRRAFRDAGTGTASEADSGIGAMPDLELVAAFLGV